MCILYVKLFVKNLLATAALLKLSAIKRTFIKIKTKKQKNQMKGMTKGRHNNGETFVQNPEMSSSFL